VATWASTAPRPQQGAPGLRQVPRRRAVVGFGSTCPWWRQPTFWFFARFALLIAAFYLYEAWRTQGTFAASGTPPASTARWCLEPFLPRSWGSVPLFSPVHRTDGGGVHDHAAEVDLAGPAELREQHHPLMASSRVFSRRIAEAPGKRKIPPALARALRESYGHQSGSLEWDDEQEGRTAMAVPPVQGRTSRSDGGDIRGATNCRFG
jgi:hypothetical protein